MNMTQRTSALVAVLGTSLALGACHRVSVSPEEMASRVAVSSCPPGVVPAKPTDPLPPASLTVTVLAEPPLPAGTEVNLRLEGNTRSSVRVDVTQPSHFSLEKGVYVVRVSVDGYVAVEGRAPLTAGCVATMKLTLKQPAQK